MNKLLALIIFSICSLICKVNCLPAPNPNLAAPGKPSELVKRQIYERNQDAELKQISLQALIGNFEQSLFQTALSVGGVAHSNDYVVPEVYPTSTEHSLSKRRTGEVDIAVPPSAVAVDQQRQLQQETTTESLNKDTVILQTTAKVPKSDQMPAHILIDRISVQPHYGGVPLIPSFEVHHTKLVATAAKQSAASDNVASSTASTEGKDVLATTPTHIEKLSTVAKVTTDEHVTLATDSTASPSATTTKTTTENRIESVTTATPAATSTSSTSSSTNLSTSTTTISTSASTSSSSSSSTTPIASTATSTTPSSTTTSTTPSTTTTTTTTTTTKTPEEELKEAEEELREKVAEIEAEPIILSARV